MFPPLNEQLDLIRRGTAEIIPEDELAQKIERSIKTGLGLNVKLGCDPSRPDLHLGHSVVLRKLRQFQDLGHTAILIVGDFTGMIGDPSGRNKSRPSMTIEETRQNGESYFQQASKILSSSNLNIVYNSEWLGKMSFQDVIKLASKYTVARMLERDDFEKRYRSGEPISVHEFLYPLAQAMDSVAIKADIELGGTDQKFNLLVGRDIQREYGLEPQVILTMPLLVGTDGAEKMSKSLGNYIAITDSPDEIYGKTLSIPDTLIYDYFVLTTNVSPQYLSEVKSSLESGRVNPRDLKRKLAREIVTIYHDTEAAAQAEDNFDKVFVRKETPTEIEEVFLNISDGGVPLYQLLVEVGAAKSNSEARRLITQGGVTIDGNKIADANTAVTIKDPVILKVGKRKFYKIRQQQSH
ncbi:MAG: tyrosine--tRNA ligase [Bacteroidetes bacterium]|nr:tyrosine--tRNA ligase [Bacteroidota bacterium]MCL5033833.1 tyrosine--tRNA ligase [Bacteroidota bacterium]